MDSPSDMETRDGLESRTRRVESVDIVFEVANCRGVAATDLPTPLSSGVDPDALETLLTEHPETSAPVQVTFEYAGCEVLVGSDGTLDVRRNASSTS